MKRVIAVLLVVCSLLAMDTAFAKEYPQKFWDVPKDYWAFGSIAELADRGVIKGYEDGSFMPEQTVTRAEWAKIMVDAAGLQVHDNSVNFTDMSGHWANNYVNAAKNYLTGYNDGTYRPDQAAVREDVTVAMVVLKGYNLESVDYSFLSQFKDNDSISNYAKKYVAVAIQNELINGFEDHTFRGQATLTRAEAATLLYRAFQKGSDNKVTGDVAVVPPVPADMNNQREVVVDTDLQKPQKPYAVDTIVETSCTDIFGYTKDENDTIFFIDEDCVYTSNIYDKNKKEYINGNDIIIDNDEMLLAQFKFTSICYDKYEDRVLVTGYFDKINTADRVDNRYLCSIENGDFEVITNDFPLNHKLVNVISNGDYITSYYGMNGSPSGWYHYTTYIVDSDKFKVKNNINHKIEKADYDSLHHDDIIDIYDNGTELYFMLGNAFCKYDYIEESIEWESDYSWIIASAVAKDSVFLWVDEKIYKYNFKGKELECISYDDIVILDKNNLVREELMYVTNHNDIVFLDTVAGAFRILKKNV